MISKVYFDLDHTLIVSNSFQTEDFDFAFKIDDEIYNVKVNPYSHPLLDFARNLVGPENAWMLTSSVRDYALHINKSAVLRFPEDQIVAREELNRIVEQERWNPEFKNPYKDKNSVLIDNLSPRENEEKMICLGIKLDSLDRYCKVDDYYGLQIEGFEEGVVEFLNRKHNENNSNPNHFK